MKTFQKKILSLTLLLFSSFLFISCQNKSGKSENNEGINHLISYVKNKEGFDYKIIDSINYEGASLYRVKMNSGKWMSDKVKGESNWWHWLDIVIPDNIETNKSLLFIGPGSKYDNEIYLDSLSVEKAIKTKSIVSHISNIPYQPIKFISNDTIDRYEDDLIAYGWNKFLKGGAKNEDVEWLLRFPMTRAVVRAMDVVQEISSFKSNSVNSFFISGASKRGWTTWTTAAVDKRVVGISPIVIDMLNVVPNFDHHYQCYGEFSPAVQDYVNYKVVDWMDSKEYEKLIAEVEPYNFKEKFTMPKFIINAASDEFFVTDSWQFYWDDLPGEKHLRYVPNAGHSLEGTYQLENLASFYYRFLNNINQPNWNWKINNDTIFVNINQGQNYKIAKWEVNNPKERDFRIYKIGKTWQKTDIETNDKGHYAIPVKSTEGYTAALVEVVFDPNGDNPLILSTGTLVTPKEYPFEKYVPEKSLGTKNN